ncbi:hypothetical protein [Synechococcus sp. MIT S9451]|uniref:hypothetical protein n=1 Tax=Synechococcus sp. MIT S9451 TaxID=3082543 RepID=UPI0039B5F336
MNVRWYLVGIAFCYALSRAYSPIATKEIGSVSQMDLVVAAALALGIAVRLAFMEENTLSIAGNSEAKPSADSATEAIQGTQDK